MSHFWRQADKMSSIKSYLIIMNEVWIFHFIHTVGRKIDNSGFFVHILYLTHIEFALRHLTNQPSFLSII